MPKKYISLPPMEATPRPFRTEEMVGGVEDPIRSIFSSPMEVNFRTRDPMYSRLGLGQFLKGADSKFYKVINFQVLIDYDGVEVWEYKLIMISQFELGEMDISEEPGSEIDFEGFKYSQVMARMERIATNFGMEDSIKEEEQEEIFEAQEGQTILLLKIDTDGPEDEEETQIENSYAMEIDLGD